MPDSGSILIKSGELSSVTAWSYKVLDAMGFDVQFQIAWANTSSPDVLVGGKLRLAGKNLVIWSIYEVEQWDKEEIEVHCYAYAEETK